MTLLQNSDNLSLQSSQSLPAAGEQFDKYTLLAKLATGGMAELFVARLSGAAGFSKTVVIKRILPHVAHDENFTQMFLDEALTCAQITHPNVCQVFELCEYHGSHFLVLEHLEGATVGDLIRRCIAAEQQLNMRLATGIIVQACDGLQAAHEQVDAEGKSIGLVHRDVSPANLFVTVHGIVKVLDFGIAKAAWMSRKTRTGTLLGKCEYMSPEQARGGIPVDRRSDIFSLGITAWELLCGRRLFRRETEYDTLKAVLRAPIENPRSLRPTIPEALDHAIMRALERDREDRFHSAYEFRKAISDALRPHGGTTPMCDIAPVIRKSFADDLRVQRATVREAAALSNKLAKQRAAHGPQSATPIPDTGSREQSNKTKVNKSRQQAKEIEAKTPPDLDRDHSDTEQNEGETEVHIPTNKGSQPKSAKSDNKSVMAAAKSRAPSSAQEINPARNAMPAARRGTPKRSGASVGVVVAVILLSACVAAAATYVAVSLLHKKDEVPARAPATSPDTSATRAPDIAPTAPSISPAIPPSDSSDANPGNGSNVPESATIAEPAAENTAQVTALEPESTTKVSKGTLSISSSTKATIFLYPDRVLLGTTPLSKIELPVGTHKLKATLRDGRERFIEVTIQAGEHTRHPLKWK